MKKGYFIVFEGGEGAGKSVVSNFVYQKLLTAKVPVVYTREPGGSALSERIRDLVLEKDDLVKIGARAELLLYLASRAQHVDEKIKPALLEGKVVLCDRFNPSTIAYQGYARGLGAEEVEKLCLFACRETLPDFNIVFDVTPEVGLLRTLKVSKKNSKENSLDRLEAEALEFHQKVREGYRVLVNRDKEHYILVSGELPLKEVSELVWEIVKEKLEL